jgi:curved DNA-binding protein CbpA
MNYEWQIHWKDYYKILQVHPTAGQEVIKAAYERLAKIYHPDLNQGLSSSQMMKEINEAYQVLGTLETRRLYHPEWLIKRRTQNNNETPPKTSTYDETTKQYESSINPSQNRVRRRSLVKWIIALAVVFIIVTMIVLINTI